MVGRRLMLLGDLAQRLSNAHFGLSTHFLTQSDAAAEVLRCCAVRGSPPRRVRHCLG